MVFGQGYAAGVFLTYILCGYSRLTEAFKHIIQADVLVVILWSNKPDSISPVTLRLFDLVVLSLRVV